MPNSIHRANIDHCLGLLNDLNLATEKRASVVKLLIAEEDKLAHDQEQLQFAENRAERGRELLHQVRYVREMEKLPNCEQADRLVENFEAIQKLLDDFCDQLLVKVINSRL